jgi:tRNA A37 N6-isopentenylltransferase MiaA
MMSQFRDLAISHMRNNFNANRVPILIGGTSYYMEAILWNMLVNDVDDTHSVEQTTTPSASLAEWYGKGLDLICNYLMLILLQIYLTII